MQRLCSDARGSYRTARPKRAATGAQWIVVALAASACTAEVPFESTFSQTAEALAAPVARPADQSLKVMTFNLFYGGDDLDLATGDFCAVPDGCAETFERIVETVRLAKADILGVQEPERNTAKLASELGWQSNERNHVISKWPILDPPGGDGVYVFVEVAPGKVVAMANVHLPSDPYGPYLVRDGGSAADVDSLERATRLPAIQDQLAKLPPLAASGIPVFLTGDFNSPSYLDWTPAVARVRPDVIYPFAWPVSKALADAGFRDSYRDIHPDPVRRPSFTWTPGSPEADPREVFDRIDWVLSDGPSRASASQLVGESGGPNVDIVSSPWPSDHRAVVSMFDVHPADMPILVAVSQRRVFAGDRPVVTYRAPGQVGERVVVTRLLACGKAGDCAPHDEQSFALPSSRGGASEGHIAVPTSDLAPGDYAARLLDGSGHELSRIPFWLYRAGQPTTVRADDSRFAAGEPISVSWRAAQGQALDWLGVFRCGPDATDASECASNADYLLYVYTKAAIEGRATIGPDALTGGASWPLDPGRYIVRLLADDGYIDVASSQIFTISAPKAPRANEDAVFKTSNSPDP